MTSDGASAADRVETLEIEGLVVALRERWGYDFAGYSAQSFRRRVLRAVQREHLSTVSELQGRILRDPDALERFIGNVSVGVTSMFRDPVFYATLRSTVFPMLRTWPFVRIWHAGCCTGEEVYSLAILLEEAGLYDRCRIYATDLSGELVATARRGVYPLRVMQQYTRGYHASGGSRDFSSWYVADDRGAILDPSLRRNVVFSVHNLVSDGVFNEFHVVLCRNVLIYFGADLREHVHCTLHGSLAHFGVLGLGMKENLLHTSVMPRYETVSEDSRIYRRIA